MRSTFLLIICILTLDTIAGCKSAKSGKSDGVSAKAVEGSENETVENKENETVENKKDVNERRGDVRDARLASKDGTRIAFEKTGAGPGRVIIVSGALAHRASPGVKPLAAKLSEHFTVYTYDRRGRGESTDVQPYSVEREIEDIEAILNDAGGSAYLYGVSSGAALALQAAAKLGPTKVPRLAIYEPPYGQDAKAFARQKEGVNALVRTGKPGEAIAFFMSEIGTPPEAIEDMKRSPEWGAMKKVEFTLAYDYAVLGDGAVPQEIAEAVTVPTLVLTGEKTMAFMRPTADRIASLMPRAQRKTLQGQTHQAEAKSVAPVLIEFFK
jgi:pimeloyl-ACP methyl ester carboxylesterase